LLIEHAPKFGLEAAVSLARELYGLRTTASTLPSERDQNFLLETREGEKFVLKIANALEERPFLEAQHEAMAHIAAQVAFCPRVVPAISGETISSAPSGANLVRLLTYLPGAPLATAEPSAALLKDLGRKIARLDLALAGFDHPAIHRDFHWDLANGLKVIDEYSPLIPEKEIRLLIAQMTTAFEQDTQPLLPNLGRTAIHNDANDYNVLVGPDSTVQDRNGGDSNTGLGVVGVIDFGDLVHSFTVADLAVAAAYAILDKPDPLAAAAQVAAGYHTERPLDKNEFAALFGLIRLRLCLSVCLAAHQQRQRPDDDYLSISQQAIRNILPKLAAINPRFAEIRFRQACGLSTTANLNPRPRAETLAERRKLIGASVRLAYQEPLKIVRGFMQYLYDDEGDEYLDAYNNVPHVGHCHPRVVKAGQEQMAILNTNTRYLHDLLNQYAKRLCATLPAPLSVCFLVNSGSEANELALRLARAHTGHRDLIVLEHAYHGNTTTLIDISPYKHNGPGGQGPPEWVHTAALPDLFRGEFKREDPQAGTKYAQEVSKIIARLHASEIGLAGFIAESMPSVGGQIVFPRDYLAAVYSLVRQAGGVCIADEVQTGLGRIGSHSWAFEAYDVVPDIVVLGKPIGNGHPIGAVITTPEIAASFDNGMEFFSTFGGNTVSCAIGLAVLDVVLDEGLQAHALAVGNHLLAALQDLKDRHAIIGDVRGSGLFLGVELVRSRDTIEPATEQASTLVNRMRNHRILLGTEGPFHNVIKIRPPMPFNIADADRLSETFARVLKEDLNI